MYYFFGGGVSGTISGVCIGIGIGTISGAATLI